MSTQAKNQASAAAPPFPATIERVPSVPSLPSQTDPRIENRPVAPCGGFPKESKPRRRSLSAKRNRRENQKKPNAKPGSESSSVPVLLSPFPKKKTRITGDPAIEQAALQEQAAVSEVSPQQAAPVGTEEVADTIALAKTDMPRLGAPAALAEKSGLLTVTLRVRHRPLAVVLNALNSFLTEAWNWTQQKLKSSAGKKRLRVCESVSLGEKRFVAVIQVDGEQFLVGGSASSVSTLAHLERPREFSDVFERHCKQNLSPA